MRSPVGLITLRSSTMSRPRRHWLAVRTPTTTAGFCDDCLRHVILQVSSTGQPRGEFLVHGDFASHNLLFEGEQLTGLLDFELATVDRRVTDLIHVWRCRYDDVLLAYHAISPLEPDEWRICWWTGGR